MNSAYLWILLPLIAAVFLGLLMRWRTVTAIIGTAIAIILAVLAAWLPAQEQIVVWRWVLPFSDTLDFFGRRLVLSAADRPALMLLYLAAALWFGAVPIARSTKLMVPLGMAMTAILTSAIAVEPFLFAAVLIEIAVLMSIPILIPPGWTPGQGVLRYLSFQTLGVPFLLLAGYLFTGFESSPGDPVFVASAVALLALGFAMLLAVFPFHTWMPMLAEEADPFPVTFILFLLPITISSLGLGFLDNFTWIKDNPNTGTLVQVVGVIMILTAGTWVAVERNLSRMIGFAVILDIGFSLLGVSLILGNDPEIYSILFFAALLPRTISLVVFGLALSALKYKVASLDIDVLRGLADQYPAIIIALVISLASLAGMPLLASFPVKLGIIEGLSFQASTISAWVVFGSFGLVIAAVRILSSAVSAGDDSQELIPGPRLLGIFLWIGIGSLFLLGLIPRVFIELLSRFPGTF